MSAYKCIECSLVDKGTLLKALKELGLGYQESEQAVALRGYEGERRSQKAEIVVPRQVLNDKFTGASNDLGFKWNEERGEYYMLVSDYDAALNITGRIKQAYAKVAIEQALEDNRFTVNEITPSREMQMHKQVPVRIVGRKVI